MTILPKNLKPSVAGGVLTLGDRLIQNRYHWLARPTDSMIVDHVDTANHRAYCRRSDDAVAHNEYPYPYDPNMTLSPGDVVLVHWDPTGPYISQGGVQTIPTSVGSGSTPPSGSPNNPPTGGGLVPSGNTCVPQPSTATAGTSGGVPPVGGTNPGSVNAGEQGYACSGAATTETTAPAWTHCFGQDPVNQIPAAAPSYQLNATGSFRLDYAGLLAGSPRAAVTIVDVSGFAYGPNDVFNIGSSSRLDQASDFRGFSWNGTQWSLAGVGVSPIQPGPRCALGIWSDCNAPTVWHFYLGTDIGHLQYAGTYTTGSTITLANNGYFLWEFYRSAGAGPSSGHAIIESAHFYTGVPGNVVFTGDTALVGSATTPPTPTIVPSSYAAAYQAGFGAYQAGLTETDNPYAGSDPQRLWWDAGWIDANNYYTGAALPGGTGTPPIYGPPATPPASIPTSPTDYRPDYDAGYQAFLDGLPMVPPATDTATQKQYWDEGWVDAYNAVHVAAGSSTGALPGGSGTSAACLGVASGDGQAAPVPITGDLNVAGSINASGCIDAPCVEVAGVPVLTAVPVASPTVLGLVKVGTNLSIDGAGVLSASGGGGGGGALAQIGRTVLGSAAASVTFTSIVGTYSDLIITFTARGDTVSNFAALDMQFNGDTGSTYQYETGRTNPGVSNLYDGTTPTTQLRTVDVAAASADANYSGSGEIIIPSYAATTFYKSATARGGVAMTTTGAGVVSAQWGWGVWRNTAAITAILLKLSAGNLVAGSTITLWGRT